jgi:hypothetical protein
MRFVSHAPVRPEAGDAAAAGLGDDAGVAAGDGGATIRGAFVWAGVEPAASLCAAGGTWPAVDGTAIIPFTAQLAMLSSPIPTASAKNRRRQ